MAWEAWQGFGNLEFWDPGKNVLIICCLAFYIFVSCLSQQRLLPGLAAQLTKYLPSTLDQCSGLFLSISKTTVIQVLHIQGQFKEIIIIKNIEFLKT